MARTSNGTADARLKKRRVYLSQADVPAFSLEQALRVCRALAEHHDGEPVSPLQLAQDLNMSPGSGPFRMLCGASIAYGLTSGGYNAEEIVLHDLGKRIVQPMELGDDFAAMREALMRPRVIREFLDKYNGKQLPPEDISSNVLASLGVPRGKCADVGELIVDGARKLGYVRDIKGKLYVDLGAKPPAKSESSLDNQTTEDPDDDLNCGLGDENGCKTSTTLELPRLTTDAELTRRVFITHGKNKAFLDPIKKLLGFGEMIPVVSVERQSVSKPVPDKVMDDMRSCGAAIIHVDEEQRLIDSEANEHVVVNPNVLMEIGAAMALYGRRFILLVKNGVTLPSNLQGLYEVRYNGDTLDGDATIRLLEAINDIKNHELPKREREK